MFAELEDKVMVSEDGATIRELINMDLMDFGFNEGYLRSIDLDDDYIRDLKYGIYFDYVGLWRHFAGYDYVGHWHLNSPVKVPLKSRPC